MKVTTQSHTITIIHNPEAKSSEKPTSMWFCHLSQIPAYIHTYLCHATVTCGLTEFQRGFNCTISLSAWYHDTHFTKRQHSDGHCWNPLIPQQWASPMQLRWWFRDISMGWRSKNASMWKDTWRCPLFYLSGLRGSFHFGPLNYGKVSPSIFQVTNHRTSIEGWKFRLSPSFPSLQRG